MSILIEDNIPQGMREMWETILLPMVQAADPLLYAMLEKATLTHFDAETHKLCVESAYTYHYQKIAQAAPLLDLWARAVFDQPVQVVSTLMAGVLE